MVIITLFSYLLLMLALFVIGYIGLNFYYRAKHDEQKYSLYRIRDKVVRFYLEGKITKENFNKLYRFVNEIITSVDKYDLIKLKNILIQAENIPEKEIRDPYIKEILEELAECIAGIIIDNSILLKFLLFINLFKRLMKVGWISTLPQITVYKEIEKFQSRLSNGLSYN